MARAKLRTEDIIDSQVTLAKQADVATASVSYRKTAGTGVPEVQTLATLKTDLGLTGTNTGDQTSIVGITGTLAQFNTAVSDADLARTDAANTFTGVQTMISPALTTPVINGLPTGTGVASAATASTVVTRDANANLSADNVLTGYTTTLVGGITTTLTVDSTYQQIFTGGVGGSQTVQLPVASTLVLGQSFSIVNNTTVILTINSSGSNVVYILGANSNTYAIVTCVLTSGTDAASWTVSYVGTKVTSGKALNVSNSLTLIGTDSTTHTFPTTTSTLARTDAAQTFAGVQTLSVAPVLTSGIAMAQLPVGITNQNTARQSQIVVSATAYYITNSAIILPNPLKSGMVVGTKFIWDVYMTKTAAGTGSFQIRIYRGTNGSTADTADVTQSLGTQTAAVDSMQLRVTMIVTATGASGAYFWTMIPLIRAATATGFGVATGTTGMFSGTVSAVAMNTAALQFGLAFIATTGTPTIDVVSTEARAYNIS